MDDEFALELEDDDPPPAGLYAITNRAPASCGGLAGPRGSVSHALTAAATAMHRRAGQSPPAKQPRLERSASGNIIAGLPHAAEVATESGELVQRSHAAAEADPCARGCGADPELDMAAPQNAAGLRALQRAAARAKAGPSRTAGPSPPSAGQDRPPAQRTMLRQVASAAQSGVQQQAPGSGGPSAGKSSSLLTSSSGRTSALHQDLATNQLRQQQGACPQGAVQPPRSSAGVQPVGRLLARQPAEAPVPPSRVPVDDQQPAVPRPGNAIMSSGVGGLPTAEHLQQRPPATSSASRPPFGMPGTQRPPAGVQYARSHDACVAAATQQSPGRPGLGPMAPAGDAALSPSSLPPCLHDNPDPLAGPDAGITAPTPQRIDRAGRVPHQVRPQLS